MDEIIGQTYRALDRRSRTLFGVRALYRVTPDTPEARSASSSFASEARARDAGIANVIHDPHDIRSRGERRLREPRERGPAHHQVKCGDPRSEHPHPHLPSSGLGKILFDDLQDFGSATVSHDDSMVLQALHGSLTEIAGGQGSLDDTSVPHLDTVCPSFGSRGHDLFQPAANEMQRGSVVRSIPRRGTPSDQLSKGGLTGRLAVVVRTRGPTNEAQAVVKPFEAPEGVGQAALEPAEHPGTDPAQDGPMLPCRPQKDVQTVGPPDGQEVCRAASTDIEDVLVLNELWKFL